MLFTTPTALVLLAACLLLPVPAAGAPPSGADAALRQAYDLLSADQPAAVRRALKGIDPKGYDLGDYVLYFSGLSYARENDREGTARALEDLSAAFPESPLVAYLSLEAAYLAAKDSDLPAARRFLAAARGKVSGNGRRSEEEYVAARLLEEEGPPAAAAQAHLLTFAAWPATEAGALSMERLWTWREEGRLREWGLAVDFFGAFARALARASERKRAAAVFREAIETFPPSEDYYTVLLDFAEFLRKQGDTKGSEELLARALPQAPPSFRQDAEFLKARVEWKAGRLADARRVFLSIAEGGGRPATGERARYLAAWIAEEEKDLAGLTEEFGRLRKAADRQIRAEALFRYGFGLFRQQRYAEAAAAFSEGEGFDFSTVEKARHTFWRARALRAMGKEEEAKTLLSALAADPGAGPYAFFAAREEGRDPYAMLEASPSGESASCERGKKELWERVRAGNWSAADAFRVRRAERLVVLGIVEYAVVEAQGVDPAAARSAIGLVDGAAVGLFRYLAGDLRGAIRETKDLPNDPAKVELIDRIQYPLAPEYVGDCGRKRSGIDSLVLHALIRQESEFYPGALSPAGAVGLMQLLPRTAAETARKEKIRKPRRRDLLRPEVNVRIGAAYFARLLRAFGGDYLRAVAAYNAGEEAVGRWWAAAGGDPALFLEAISYRETRFYVRRVFLNLLQYYLVYRPAEFARYFPAGARATPPDHGGAAPRPGAGPGVAGGSARAFPEGAKDASSTPPPPGETPASPAAPAQGRR